MNELILEPVEIEDDFGVFAFEEPLVLPSGISIVEGSQVISISGEVEPITTKEYTYNINDITFINLDEEEYTVQITDDISEIILEMTEPQSVIDELETEDFDLFIDVSDFELGENQGEIFVKFNEKTYDYELSKNSLTILLEEKNGDSNSDSEEN